MLRSMYSGISGMKNFQTKLDVIGNNIANVNTYGFKKGRTTFQDLFSQQISGATAPGDARGGVNPKQVGLGGSLATIDTIHTDGSTQTTGRTLDLAINGDGFFVVGSLVDPATFNPDPDVSVTDGNQITTTGIEDAINMSYTRAGNFYLDSEGYLVNGNGLYLIGDAATKAAAGTAWALSGEPGVIQIPTDAQSFSIGSDGKVTFIDSAGTLSVAGQIKIAKFANNGGLEKAGANLFRETTNSGSVDKDADGDITLAELNNPGQNGSGTIAAGALEMSNVDLSEEFTEMIVAQRGFQANTRIITTSDEILNELINLKR